MVSRTALDYDNLIKVPVDGLPGAGDNVDEKCLPKAKNRISTVLISEEDIRLRIEGLGREIAEAYKGKSELLLTVVLKGAFVFAADLGRAIYRAAGPEVKFDFIKASVYGEDLKGPGETARVVAIDMEPTLVKGKEIVLVEDIVDQGYTLARVKKFPEAEGATSVKICTLLNKVLDNPTGKVRKLRKSLSLDYVGFDVPDRWIAGFGTDAGEDFRFLPCIVAVDEDYYRWGA